MCYKSKSMSAENVQDERIEKMCRGGDSAEVAKFRLVREKYESFFILLTIV